MRAGGVLDGVIALVTVVVIGSHACCDWIVTLNVCWFVPATVANVHVIGADVVASPSRSIVTVPVHLPARNESDAVGAEGAVPPPQPDAVGALLQPRHRRRTRFSRADGQAP